MENPVDRKGFYYKTGFNLSSKFMKLGRYWRSTGLMRSTQYIDERA